MPFFTGKGDDGSSRIFGSPQRITKSDPRFTALGMVDELTSLLGVCRALVVQKEDNDVASWLRRIQEHLFIIQAEIGAIDEKNLSIKPLSQDATRELEEIIADITPVIGTLNAFVIPGGDLLSSILDYARTIARRTERQVVVWREASNQPINQNIFAYLNRLSGTLFALARYVKKKHNISEEHPTYQ